MKSLISFFLKIFYGSNKSCNPTAAKRILVMDFGHIGDLVTDFPFLYELKRIFPQAKIDFACGFWGRTLVEYNHNVAAVMIASLPTSDRDETSSWSDISLASDMFRRNDYDLSFDLTGNLSSAIINLRSGARCKMGRDLGGYNFPYLYSSSSKSDHEVENKLKLLRFFDPNVKFLKYDFEPPGRLSQEVSLGRFAVVQPSTPWRPRDWGIEKYHEVINRLIKELDLTVIVIGGKDEVIRNHELVGENIYNMTGKLAWTETAHLLRESQVFIGSDSGPAHLAAAVGARSVVLMGPGEYPRFAPYNPEAQIKIIRHEACEKQKDNSCQQKYGQDHCDKQFNLCMQSINIDEVFDAVAELVKK